MSIRPTECSPTDGDSEHSNGLLANVKILAFSHWLQGPAACQYLADLGADVIKIEPITGAAERNLMGVGPGPDGASPLFVAGNRNQRSLAIDLKSADGKQLIQTLMAEYDVVIENFRPGAMAKLGLAYDDLVDDHPRLIYASASGYGSTGPLAGEPGQDLLAQALSGIVAATGANPTPVGAAVIDQHGAALLALGVLAAVTSRQITNRGQRIESNLLNAALDLQMEALTFHLNGGDPAAMRRHPNLATWYHASPYGIYECQDGAVAVSIADLNRLSEAIPALSGVGGLDPMRDRDVVAGHMKEFAAQRRTDAAVQELLAAGTWVTRVLTYDEVFAHPQVVHNEVLVELGDGTWKGRTIRHPVRYNGNLPDVRIQPPALGQHTRTILAEQGYSEAEIARLARTGAVGLSAADAAEKLPTR